MQAKDFAYGSFVATSLGFEEAVEAAKAALAAEGWSIVFEIDMASMLNEKLDVDLKPYRILGACNPQLALEALRFEDQVGLLMPCNVVISQRDQATCVSVINARELLRATNNGMIFPLADRVDEQLADVLARIPA